MEKLPGHRRHAIVTQQIGEDVEVVSLVDSRVLAALPQVGKRAPLSLLMGDDGRVVGHAVLVVAWKVQVFVVVVHALWSRMIPVEPASPTFHVIFRAIVPRPSATYVKAAIDASGIRLLPISHPAVAPSDPITSRFVAGRHHQERGMIAIASHHTLRLVHEITVDGHAAVHLHTMVGPARSLGSQIEAYLIGRCERSLRRTVAVETHGVETILFALDKDVLPTRHVGRREARKREVAIFYRAANPNGMAVEIELCATDADLTHSEGRATGIIVRAHD